jgi:hypothetical protein
VAGRERVHARGGNVGMHGSLQPDGDDTVLQALDVVTQRVRTMEKERRFIGSDRFGSQQRSHGFDNRRGTAGTEKLADPFRRESRGSTVLSPQDLSKIVRVEPFDEAQHRGPVRRQQRCYRDNDSNAIRHESGGLADDGAAHAVTDEDGRLL